MSGVLARVIRAEGLASAWRRGVERAGESLRLGMRLTAGHFAASDRCPLLNVCAMPAVARLGGLPIQLRARLQVERSWREVALFHPGLLEVRSHARRLAGLADALARTGAAAIHLEGSFGMPLTLLLEWPGQLILSLHDLDLLRQPPALREALFARADAVVYPSAFLQSAYGVPGEVIEPGTPARAVTAVAGERRRIAYVGSLKPHKGGGLLPELIAHTPGAQWHVFGGGDPDLLAAVGTLPGVVLHGYHHAGDVPRLLARQRIGLAVLPSLVPESFGLTLSECWLAQIPALVFDHGAQAERIHRHGGGWVVPLDTGAAGLTAAVKRWLDGAQPPPFAGQVATPRDAALAHRALYQRLLR